MIIDPDYLNPDGTYPEWLSEFVRCRKWLEDALKYSAGTHSITDVLDAVATNHMQLWSCDTAAIVTEIMVYPQKKILHMPLVGGNLEGLELLAPSVKEFSKFINCDGVTIAGRRGWERTFVRDFGFKPLYHWMYMEN
jgi:hypothetical protein